MERVIYFKHDHEYWQDGPFGFGKLKEHPEIMTQGESFEEQYGYGVLNV